MQTKRERTRHQASEPVLVPVSFERIEESFLKEDFQSVENLSGQFISAYPEGKQSEEARYLRALALVKLGRSDEGRRELMQLDRPGLSQDMKERVAASLAYLRPPLSITPKPQPLRQLSVEENSFYSVQVGSFASASNAERLLNRLLNSRYAAYIKKDEATKRYRVRVGQLSTRRDANLLEERLKKDGYPTKISS